MVTVLYPLFLHSAALKFHLDLETSGCMYYRERERKKRKGEGGEEKGKIPVYL